MMLPLLHADIFGGRRSTRLLAMPFFQKEQNTKINCYYTTTDQ
jgi:hypothetical protein